MKSFQRQLNKETVEIAKMLENSKFFFSFCYSAYFDNDAKITDEEGTHGKVNNPIKGKQSQQNKVEK